MAESVKEQTINFEIALKLADTAVFAKAKRHLRNIEVAVLRGAWLGQKYDQIAVDCGYAPEYIKHDVGPKLWQVLSSSLGEKVNKNNLMAVLAQRTFCEEEKNQDEKEEFILSSLSSPDVLSPSVPSPNF
jgi:hypothetical protein